MASVPFHYLDLRAFCYATEDDQRVARALQLLLPEAFELDRARSEGHHGDRILVLSGRVETTDEMRTVIEQLRGLPEAERDRLRTERGRRVDEDCSFFVSLDKQAAFGGEVRLGEGITLRGKVEAYPASRERALEALAEAEIP